MDLISLDTSMQLWIGSKVPPPWDIMFMIHLGVCLIQNAKRLEQAHKGWNMINQLNPMPVFIYLWCWIHSYCSRFKATAIKSSFWLIHNKTKCVWYSKMESTKYPESKYSWFPFCVIRKGASPNYMVYYSIQTCYNLLQNRCLIIPHEIIEKWSEMYTIIYIYIYIYTYIYIEHI